MVVFYNNFYFFIFKLCLCFILVGFGYSSLVLSDISLVIFLFESINLEISSIVLDFLSFLLLEYLGFGSLVLSDDKLLSFLFKSLNFYY